MMHVSLFVLFYCLVSESTVEMDRTEDIEGEEVIVLSSCDGDSESESSSDSESDSDSSDSEPVHE